MRTLLICLKLIEIFVLKNYHYCNISCFSLVFTYFYGTLLSYNHSSTNGKDWGPSNF